MIVVILNKETILAEFEIIGNPKPYMDSDKPTVRASADCTWRICPGLVIVLLPKMQSHNNTQNFRPTIQPPYQPPPLYKGCGPVVKNEVPARIVPKAALNPYQCRWAIKARVTAKVDLRRYNNARGDGNIFLFDLLDSDGVTCFNAAVDRFYNVIEVGKVYMISKGSLKPAQKNFNHLKNEWEILLESTSTVELCPDEDVTSVNPSVPILRKNGMETQRRILSLKDSSGRREGQQLQEMVDTGSFLILAVKAGKVNDFSGKSIGSISTTQLFINPDFPEAHSLREWFDRVGKDSASLSISKDIIPGAVKNKVRKTVSQMKDEGLGRSDKPDWIIVRAAILFIKTDTFCCTACPLMIGDRRCNKKVTRSGNTRWQCDRCNQEFEEGKRLWKELYGDEQKVKITVVKAEKVNYSSESKYILDSISKFCRQ
ncbi:hypothetical protein GYH30_024267 [Glycine max]|uniref:Replication factor A C-terminal domain-containing protein n=1 Tax=Glycine max TaxID=3847 RepID=K7LC90_SOYBN|nr:hypothetical protein GYH30_024267 [Glycine max]